MIQWTGRHAPSPEFMNEFKMWRLEFTLRPKGQCNMKRFYCTICQSVKRVRSLPTNVETPRAPMPEKRIGQCDKHSYMESHDIPVVELNMLKIRSNRKVN